MSNQVKVWDIYTRFFHWSLVGLVAVSFATYYMDLMDVHIWAGQITLTLIIFRLMWGLWGSSTARFAQFVKCPKEALAYLKSMRTGEARSYYGHNPAGGWMVMALLAGFLTQAVLGLFSEDSEGNHGPLARTISVDMADMLTEWHEELAFIMLGFVAVHVLSIIIYRLRNDDLLSPMFSGLKEEKNNAADTPMVEAPLVKALLTMSVAVGIVAYIII